MEFIAPDTVFADVGDWVNEPNGATTADINTLKQETGQVGARCTI